MKTSARPLIAAAGVAVVGAGLIAAMPAAASSGNATTIRSSDAGVALTATFSATASPESLLAMTGGRLLEQLRQAPLVPTVMAAAALGGDTQMLYSQIRQVIDAPLYVFDPTFEAAANALPAGIGGGSDHNTSTTADDGDFMQIRNQIQAGQTDLREGIADLLGASTTGPGSDTNYAWIASNLLLKSAVDTGSLAIQTPLAFGKLAEAVVSGKDAKTVYTIAQSIVDGPQWAIDSGIDGIATVLPKSLGGGTDYIRNEETSADGALLKFRNNQMLGLRNQVRVGVAGLIGVDVNSDGSIKEPPAARQQLADNAKQPSLFTTLKSEADKLTGNNTGVSKQIGKLGGAAKQARNDAKAEVQKVRTQIRTSLNKAKDTVKNAISKKDAGDK